MKKLEKRFSTAEFRIEERDGKPPVITGYAAVFNSLSLDLGGFRELIRPGAFARTLGSADVRALVNHDPNLVLGRNKAGTLRLSEDERGLKMEIDPPNTGCGRDILESLRRGDIDNCSFGFYCVSDSWADTGDGIVRELCDVDLLDTSVVTYPAYEQTSVAVRMLDELRGAVVYAAGPILDADTWDGKAAESLVRSWASQGDKIDYDKYRKAFGWFDSKDPEQLGSYKLIHHTIRDGKLVVHKAGVQAAMNALLGGRGGVAIPDADRKPVYNHLCKHLDAMGLECPDFHSAPPAEQSQIVVPDLRWLRQLDAELTL
jgi:Escherichia/Staphylococcus phage prohead protease